MRGNLCGERSISRKLSAQSQGTRIPVYIPANRTATAECTSSCTHLSDGRVGRGHVVDRRSSSGVQCCTTLSLEEEARTVDGNTGWTWGRPVQNSPVHLLGQCICWCGVNSKVPL